jgi:hypothetical protein
MVLSSDCSIRGEHCNNNDRNSVKVPCKIGRFLMIERADISDGSDCKMI